MSEETYKIISLEAQNVKRVSAVEIKPDGNVVVIGGNNGQGKSSVLDSILYALGGKKGICAKPLREGQKKGKVVCDLGRFKVTRTFTDSGGGALTVENGEGAKYSSPQNILDAMVGELGFDPLAFAKEPGKQLERLKALVGLDFSVLDEQRKSLYAERTIVNRDLKSAKARLDEVPHYEDAPKDPVSVSSLMGELEDAQRTNDANERKRRNVDSLVETGRSIRATISDLNGKIDELRGQIERLQDDIAAEEKNLSDIIGEHTEAKAEADSLVDVDLGPIRARIDGAEDTNEKIRANSKRDALVSEVESKQAESDSLTEKIAEIDADKERQLSEAKFPVDGLSFDENGVTYGGLPFDQASSAEQLRVSVAMGLAMNPKLKVLLIRDGSLMDTDSLKTVADMAAAADAQVWIERVGKGKECQVIIEDGMVEK